MAEIENTATIRVVADASGVEAGLRPAVDAARRAEQAVSQVGNGAVTSSRNVEAGARNIVAAIQRTTVAMESGGRQTAAYYEALARQRGVDPAVLAPYIAQLRAVEQAQARTASSAGVSAGQISAAMRTVPAQFTDIVTAIQGGQRPLTVLLQQGGQLRDQFGSAGLAARSLGGYVLGLINPYTVAAGAVIALTAAYKAGAEEVSGYAKALAVTGNAAGATADQLNEMSRQISAIGGNRGAAAEAITALASTGQVSVENLQKFGLVAADVQRVIGRSVSDTAADFAKLGKAPLSALTEINDKYHFITAATYAQVKALQDQGKAAEAADVAQKAYADGINTQRQKVMDSLTDWERGWIRIKDAAGGAVDAVIDFATGRGATNSEKITGLLEQRGKIEENMSRARARNLQADVASYQAELDANERAINAIRNKDKASKDAAKSEGDAAQATQANIKWIDDGNKYLSRQLQLKAELKRVENEGEAAGISKADIDKRLAAVRQSYSDIYNAGIESNIAALKRRDQVQDVISQREVARIQAQRTLGGVSEADAINQTADAEDKAFGRHRALLERELALTKGKANSIKEQSDLEGQIDVLDAQRASRKIQQGNELVALSEKQRAASEALYIAGVTRANDELDGLKATVVSLFDYNQEIGLSKTQVAELRAARLENTASLKEESAAALDAIEPGSKLAAIYRAQAQALRDQASEGLFNANKEQRVDQWRSAVQQYDQIFSQGFADMLNGGEKGWQSFTKSLVTTFKTSVADQIYKMFVRPIIVQLVGSYAGVGAQAIAGEIASQQGGGPPAGGGGNSAVSMAQQASSLYSAGKTMYMGFQSGITSTLGGYVTSLGNTFGTSAVSSFGAGMSGGAPIMAELGQGTATGAAATADAGAVSAGASSAGYAIPIAGWIAFGMSMSDRLYKQGWDANNGSVNSLGKVVNAPMFAANNILKGIGLSDSAANILAGMGPISKLFGRKNPKIESQGIEGTFDTSGFSGDAFANIIEEGGWFRGDKRYTKNADLSTSQDASLDSTIQAMMVAVDGFASTLGLSTATITGYSKKIKLELTGDDAKDQAAIAKLFGDIGDELSSKLVPNLAQFTKTGETASTTLQRLASDFQVTTSVAQLLGKTAAEAFGTAGFESAAARERLVTLAGGTSTLTSQAQSYAQNYLTDDEKLAPVRKAVEEAMASLGLAAVQTRDQFKGIVNSLDLTTEAGAKEFTSLMALADAFAQVHAANDNAADLLQLQAQTYDLLNDKVGKATVLQKQHALALIGLSPSLRDATKQLWNLQAAADAIDKVKSDGANLLNSVDNAYSVLQSVVGREKDVLQKRITKEEDAVSKLKSLTDSIHSAIDSFNPPVAEEFTRLAAQDQIKAALAALKAGKTLSDADASGLKKAFTTVNKDPANEFSSYQDYMRDLLTTQNNIVELGSTADDQLSVQQQQLDADKAQLTSLDAALANAKEQVDVLKGISNTALSIEQAMAGLGLAIAGAGQNASVASVSSISAEYQKSLGRAPDAAGLDYWQNAALSGTPMSTIAKDIAGSTEASLDKLYQQVLGRAPDSEGLAYWMKTYGSTMDAAEQADWLKAAQKDPGYKLKSFAVGTNSLPSDMLAQVHQGERIIPAADNRELMRRLSSPSDNSAALVAEVKALRDEVALLRKAGEKTADNTGRHADMFENATAGGGALLVEIA